MQYYSQLTSDQRTQLDAFIQQTLPAQISALQALIQIPSVKAEPQDKFPFGADMQRALDYTLAHATSLGFSVRDLDGYVGIASYGEGAETLGILAHLDVVPAGEGWSLPPFSGEVRGGKLYGRGAIDDKGPAISALYALAAVAAAKIPLRRGVQIILGCDEESGFACMDRFALTEPLPDIAFSPDASYPLVYSEKAILQATYAMEQTGSSLRIRCGERANVVPGVAEAVFPGTYTQTLAIDGFHIEMQSENNETRLRVEGLSGHAADPELGKNALQALLKALCMLPLACKEAAQVQALHRALRMDVHGEALGIDTTDESGRLTLNAGVLHWDDAGAHLVFDARVPHSLPPEEVLCALSDALAPAGFRLSKSSCKPKHIVPKDSELVQSLMGVYRAQTGDTESQPLSIGGGTYARTIPTAVAFGCVWPGEAGLAHMPNEYISIEDLLRNTRMMADAIVALAGK